MKIQFLNSKTGLETCTCDSIFLHSSYNPTAEAERFVNNLTITNDSDFLIFIAPGLPYCASLIKNKFPNIKIIAIQFSEEIAKKSSDWYKQWDPSYSTNLFSFLSNIINEFNVNNLSFTIWQPSIKIWKNEITKTTEYIHSLIERAISVQSTRNFFGKRWFKNSITNTALLKNPCIIKHSKNDVCIIAAGPSLNAHIENLKSIKIPTIAVSSTCCTLTENKIKPTFFISTDGGFWTKELFFPIIKNDNYSDTPICISSESNIPSFLHFNRKIIPLTYNSFLEKKLYELTEITPIQAKENGTVSGTMLDLANNLFDGTIYIAGLDLANTKNSTHCKPYQRDYREESSYNRLNSFPIIQKDSMQLEQYKNWFNTRPINLAKRCKLLEPSKTLFNNFSFCNWNEVHEKNHTEDLIIHQKSLDNKIRFSRILNFLDNIKKDIITNRDDLSKILCQESILSEILFYADWKNAHLLASEKNKNSKKCILNDKLFLETIKMIEQVEKKIYIINGLNCARK